jgi:hypothetical protein
MKNVYLGLYLSACTSDSLSPEKNTDEETITIDIGAEVEEAFRVPERPWDLALSPNGHVFCSSQSGSKLYSWNPQTQLREESNANFADIQALQFKDDVIYYTTTQYGVTGTLSVMDGMQSEVLHTQADDGVLFRWPMDLISVPSGEWIIADYEAGLLFIISTTGEVTAENAGTNVPEALAYSDPYLYIGGEDGVFQMEWPNGAVEKIDDRAAYGLEIVDDELWAGNSNQGVYIVGGASLGFTQAARVGSMLWTGEILYFADKVGEGIWMASWK